MLAVLKPAVDLYYTSLDTPEAKRVCAQVMAQRTRGATGKCAEARAEAKEKLVGKMQKEVKTIWKSFGKLSRYMVKLVRKTCIFVALQTA